MEEKRSTLLKAKPVSSEEEALEFIQAIKTSCWDATHNCYAYSVEQDALYQRYSDDGSLREQPGCLCWM